MVLLERFDERFRPPGGPLDPEIAVQLAVRGVAPVLGDEGSDTEGRVADEPPSSGRVDVNYAATKVDKYEKYGLCP